MVNTVIAKIEAQQVGHNEYSPVYQVGEHLKDICRSYPEQADLLLNDLDNPEMTIVKAERKIKEFADKHKKGGAACVPPGIADKILRDFYGLAPAPEASEQPKEQRNVSDGIIDLADFM